MQGLALEGVRRKLKEFHDSIGEEGGEEDAERQRAKVMRLLLELGYEEVAEPEEPPQAITETNGISDAGTGMRVISAPCAGLTVWLGRCKHPESIGLQHCSSGVLVF